MNKYVGKTIKGKDFVFVFECEEAHRWTSEIRESSECPICREQINEYHMEEAQAGMI
jgi:hypothetical protein